MRLYTLIDWCTYLIWIFGAWTIKSEISPQNGFAVSAAQYEIASSTLLYVFCILIYVLLFLSHRFSKGRLFPGLIVVNDDWPDTCPSISFDRRQWRQRDESLQEYRQRVTEAYRQNELTLNQPLALNEMSSDLRTLSRSELNQLRTFPYNPEDPKGMNVNYESKSTRSISDIDKADHISEFTAIEVLAGEHVISDNNFTHTPSQNKLIKEDESIVVNSGNQLNSQNHERNPDLILNDPNANGLSNQQEMNDTKKSIDKMHSSIDMVVRPIITKIEPNISTKELNNGSEEIFRTTDKTCALCIDDYEKGDIIRELKCGHLFHADCVDEWLLQVRRSCPVCNRDAFNITGVV
jgi:hypothetical protein